MALGDRTEPFALWLMSIGGAILMVSFLADAITKPSLGHVALAVLALYVYPQAAWMPLLRRRREGRPISPFARR